MNYHDTNDGFPTAISSDYPGNLSLLCSSAPLPGATRAVPGECISKSFPRLSRREALARRLRRRSRCMSAPRTAAFLPPAVVQNPTSGNYWAYRHSGPTSRASMRMIPIAHPMAPFLNGLPPQSRQSPMEPANTILFGEFYNFDPAWPQYASLFSPLFGFPANYPMSLVNNCSVWTSMDTRPWAAGFLPLN